MIIKFPIDISEDIAVKYLLENNHSNKFSLKQKVYYCYFRKILPAAIRKILQNKINSNIAWKKDFIDDRFVKKVYSEIDKRIRYKDGKDSAIVLTHDVEDKKGFQFITKILEVEKKYGFKSSWNIVPYKYKIDDGMMKVIRDDGQEIGIHGYNHDGKLYYSQKIFNARVPFINEALKRYGAVGFRSPMVHRNLEWLQKLDIEYDASCFDYDPFQPFPGGTGSIWPFIAGKFVELPYTLPQDHVMFYVLKQKDISIWKNKADWIAKNKGVILILTHPDYLIEKRHFEMYEELLKYLKTFDSAWHCLPRELSEWWKVKLSTDFKKSN